MGLTSAQQALRSSEPSVVIEAPAGCGKTYEAVSAAVDLARNLSGDQEVLLLAHTNAAVQVFRSRVRGLKAPVHATTLDAFALEQVTPYASQLGLPNPLRVDGPDRVEFSELAPKLCELFDRVPATAKALRAITQ